MSNALPAQPAPGVDPVVAGLGNYTPEATGYDFNRDPSANFATAMPDLFGMTKEDFSQQMSRQPNYAKRQRLTLGQLARDPPVVGYDTGGQGETDGVGFFPINHDDGSPYGLRTRFPDGTILFRTSKRAVDGTLHSHKFYSIFGLNRMLRSKANKVDISVQARDMPEILLSPFDRPELTPGDKRYHPLNGLNLTIAGVVHSSRGAYDNNFVSSKQKRLYHYQMAVASKVKTHNVFSYGSVPPTWNGARLHFVLGCIPDAVRDVDLAHLSYRVDTNSHIPGANPSPALSHLFDANGSAMSKGMPRSNSANWQIIPVVTPSMVSPMQLTHGEIWGGYGAKVPWFGSTIEVGRFSRVDNVRTLSTSTTRRYQSYNLLVGEDDEVTHSQSFAGITEEELDRIPKMEMWLTPGGHWGRLR